MTEGGCLRAKGRVGVAVASGDRSDRAPPGRCSCASSEGWPPSTLSSERLTLSALTGLEVAPSGRARLGRADVVRRVREGAPSPEPGASPWLRRFDRDASLCRRSGSRDAVFGGAMEGAGDRYGGPSSCAAGLSRSFFRREERPLPGGRFACIRSAAGGIIGCDVGPAEAAGSIPAGRDSER